MCELMAKHLERLRKNCHWVEKNMNRNRWIVHFLQAAIIQFQEMSQNHFFELEPFRTCLLVAFEGPLL
jgi:hypothetical protein